MKKHYTIIANWKMYLSYQQARTLIDSNMDQLSYLSNHCQLAICPSFDVLSFAYERLQKINVNIGAQTCSQYQSGAYTGQVSAQSLAELGCSLCIVGHSEQRYTGSENNAAITDKIVLLLQNNITPIVCIGEPEQSSTDAVVQYIKNQLVPITNALRRYATASNDQKVIYLAYEPVWAIGSGLQPNQEQIQRFITTAHYEINKIDQGSIIKYLYGGSITASSIQPIKAISDLEGFLIGSASIDFQEFKKIVLSLI